MIAWIPRLVARYYEWSARRIRARTTRAREQHRVRMNGYTDDRS